MNTCKIISVVLFVWLISSCNKNDEPVTGIGDALIISKISGTSPVYGISLYAYTFSAFKSVSATGSAEPGKTYTLQANQGYKSNFYYETPDAEYKTTKPAESVFNFSAIFENGTANEFKDELSSLALVPAVIDTCKYKPEKNVLRIVWKPVTGVDSYTINILDDSTQVFASYQFNKTVNAYSVTTQGTGWVSGYVPVNGKTYRVKVVAYLYEADKTTYNLQSISIAETEVVWGE